VLHTTFESIPLEQVTLVARAMPQLHLPSLLHLVASEMGLSVHLAYVLTWAGALMREHHAFLLQNPTSCIVSLRVLQKGVQAHYEELARLSSNNAHVLNYVCGIGPADV
jgi:hypothetical protein